MLRTALIFILTFFGLISFLLYSHGLNPLDVDGRGYYLRAIDVIPNRFNDIYFPVSFIYSFFFNYIFWGVEDFAAIILVNYLFFVAGLWFVAQFCRVQGFKCNLVLYFLLVSTPITFRYLYYCGKESILFFLISGCMFFYAHIVKGKRFSFAFFSYWVGFITFAAIGTWARPYFLAHLLVPFLVFFGEFSFARKVTFGYILCCIFALYHFKVEIAHYSKLMFYNSLSLLISPNPFRPENWAWFVETFVSLLGTVTVFFYLFSKRLIIKFLLLICIYGAPGALIVYLLNTSGTTDAYGVFFTRTRFPVYTFLFFVLGSWFLKKFRIRSAFHVN